MWCFNYDTVFKAATTHERISNVDPMVYAWLQMARQAMRTQHADWVVNKADAVAQCKQKNVSHMKSDIQAK
jgi:hypothetical protein